MGIQMMGSQGNGQQSQFPPLAWQSSPYNLTLDEVQNQLGDLGKPLSSMNLDELLKNVWSVEVNPVMGMDTENSALPGPVSSASGLHRQGSMTLTQALSKKMVDEVWRDIQQGQSKGREERREKERQPTLGEMTLEDFLMKAGIVAEERKKKGEGDPQNLEGISNVGSVLGADPMVGPQNFPQHPPWMQQYQLPLLHQQQHQQPQHQQQNMMDTYMAGRPVSQPLGVGGGAGPLLDVAYPENQIGMSPPLMGTLSDTQTPGRKRVAPGDVVEKTVERRQKRMIKNRESAARSRARKQVYTNKLENKVSRLEEENERLKKQKRYKLGIANQPFNSSMANVAKEFCSATRQRKKG